MQNNQDKNFSGVKFASRTIDPKPAVQQAFIPKNFSRKLKGKTKQLPGLKVVGALIVFSVLVLEGRPILSFGRGNAQVAPEIKAPLASVPAPTVTSASAGSPSAATTTAAVPAENLAPAPALTPIGKLAVSQTPTGFLNVRRGPSTDESIITQVYPGQVLSYAQSQGGWYEVILKNGESGWVDGLYVTTASSSTAPDARQSGGDYDPAGEDAN